MARCHISTLIPALLLLLLARLCLAAPQQSESDGGIFDFDFGDDHPSALASTSSSAEPGSPTPRPGLVAGSGGSGSGSNPTTPFLRMSTSDESLPFYISPFASGLLRSYDVRCPNVAPEELDFLSLSQQDAYTGGLQQLCTNAADDEPPGVGCQCTTDSNSKVPRVRCPRERANRYLYITRAPSYCRNRCGCRIRSPTPSDGDGSEDKSTAVRTWTRSGSWGDAWGAFGTKTGSLSSKNLAGLAGLTSGSFALQMCGSKSRCSAVGGCGAKSASLSAAGGRSCQCVLKTEVVDVKNRKSWFSGACEIISPRLAGRGLRPCVCNGTYVSTGCCGAEGGLVWESPQMKLGEMLDGKW